MARLKRLSTNETGTEPDNHFNIELAWIAKSDGADGRVPPAAQEGEQICLGLKCHPRSPAPLADASVRHKALGNLDLLISGFKRT